MAFKPLGKRVLVEREQEEKKTASGLIIPDNATEKPSIGVVKEISKEVEKAGEIKKGDKVLFGKYKGSEVKLDNKDYIVLDDEDILGVLK
ncbi:co-chaperone GroES [Helicobacter saguini]|uniref:Co-chaperonin GroES n=1 Tax=Helicobacter saguini TaxID=1548018 RepID=A0A347VTM0_9HELI|nr:co-chaperone GroES [Helicobacter saguini]MWV62042.1 co-chaperone GroES [Helicobacter saguini]MWV67285.1 co-chaperone GroES [Helicobacter saguini]MWV69638.1 co-chaperone GroES [Helicobacter saguini]MWV70811.1 co-chaperone GroES [Helicobacter saguini]TLD94348.1 co-chaperone GroES [Helicobacter saguini]